MKDTQEKTIDQICLDILYSRLITEEELKRYEDKINIETKFDLKMIQLHHKKLEIYPVVPVKIYDQMPEEVKAYFIDNNLNFAEKILYKSFYANFLKVSNI